jgi:zinc transport system substrate-binding protein
LAATVLACGGAAGDAGGGRGRSGSGQLSVFVDSYPLSYFAQRIGGDRVAVSFPIPSGVDPQFWTPDANLIARYQAADLILVNGAGYAAWVDTATLPGSRLVDTSIGFADRLLPLENAVTHSHGGMAEHSHAGYATMPWLDPMLAVEQATAIASAFSSARPESAAAFADGLAALRRDLEALDARLAAVAGRIGTAPLVFSHPVYSYLARRYGLNGRSLHWDPAEVPGYFALAQLDEKLAGHPALWMIWEAEPLAETAAELERRGIRSLVFDPLAGAPASGDYLSVMGENVARLEAAFPQRVSGEAGDAASTVRDQTAGLIRVADKIRPDRKS